MQRIQSLMSIAYCVRQTLKMLFMIELIVVSQIAPLLLSATDELSGHGHGVSLCFKEIDRTAFGR